MAKGRNLLAEEIKAEARWAGVPIIENPPLARSLYRSVEVGQAIPVDLYAAVAAILAYLYRQQVEAELRERRAREAAARARTQTGRPAQDARSRATPANKPTPANNPTQAKGGEGDTA
jgi:flagellar biosynthetic protein FlhB